MSASPSSEAWLKGTYFDGRRSAGHPADIRLEGAELLVRFGEQEQRSPADAARLGIQVGKAMSYLHLSGGAVFESADQSALAALARRAGGRSAGGWLHRLETSYRLILASAVVVVLFIVGGLVYGVPWVSKQIAYAVPVELEHYLGDQSLDTLDRLWTRPSDLPEARQQAVHAAFAPHLAALSERYPAHRLRVELRASERIGANALALPAGIIVFSDDLVNLAEDDDELVAILAHEAGHAVHRHSLRGIVQGSLALWLIMSITGDITAASDLTSSLPALLANLSYGRDMEREADAFALQYLLEEGIDPMHFAHIMGRLEASHGLQSSEEGGGFKDFLSTHPPTPERIRLFREAAQAE
jgi:Zn-dependent protease with chaperone function